MKHKGQTFAGPAFAALFLYHEQLDYSEHTSSHSA